MLQYVHAAAKEADIGGCMYVFCIALLRIDGCRHLVDRVPRGGVVGSNDKDTECTSRPRRALPPHPAWDAINRVPTPIGHRCARPCALLIKIVCIPDIDENGDFIWRSYRGYKFLASSRMVGRGCGEGDDL